MRIRLAAGVAFLSGFVALGYEILWARRLSDIIGATAFASSLVVGAFFLFLALGALLLGPRATRAANPWRFYAGLELGILVAILPSLFGEPLSRFVFGTFGDMLLRQPASFIVKACLAVVFVGPASFLMGGTLPAMGQAVVRHSRRLGREGNTLYGLNTLGAACGILATTFLFVPGLGMMRSFAMLLLGSVTLAGAAWWMGGWWSTEEHVARRPDPPKTDRTVAGALEHAPPAVLWFGLAFFSGFIVLGLEILALHLFSQVLHNSTYTFASVLVVVILALSVGALVTQRLSLKPHQAWHSAGLVLLLGAACTAVLPRLFFHVTGGMSPFSSGGPGLTLYVVRILAVGALTLGPPFVLLGWVFPLVLAGHGASAPEESGRPSIGQRWGKLLAVNAAGALLGMTLVNHLTMSMLGLWMSLVLWCLVALAAGVLVTLRSSGTMRWVLLGLVVLVVAALAWSNSRVLPRARLDDGERLVDWRAGADGVAAVIERIRPYRDTRIKWNNTYSLGGASNAAQQMRLGSIALLLHPQPRNVAFIGMATGITASAGVRDPAQPRVTTVELSPQIAALACEHFARLNSGLCTHERSRIVVEDGRMFFHSTSDTFDVVVGDLFVPWRAGVANLFTREHFHSVRARLHEDGIFAQWLPLFQMDAVAFWGITATFLETFPNAWLAIADFQPYNAAVALIGWKDAAGAPDWSIMQRRTQQMASMRSNRFPVLRSAEGLSLFLVGPVAGFPPDDAAVMTQDRPWLGDHAARVERMHPPPMLQGQALVNVLQAVANDVPPGPLRDGVVMGQLLYQFCGIVESQGVEEGRAWLAKHVPHPLPEVLATPAPRRWSWPFPQRAGQILVLRALEEARTP